MFNEKVDQLYLMFFMEECGIIKIKLLNSYFLFKDDGIFNILFYQ